MAKISKEAAKRHKQALDLVHSDKRLTLDDRFFILENFHEGATNMNGLAGAFFTPEGLARDLSIEVCGGGRSIIDLCAGIGGLAFACRDKAKRIVCVEQNPEYAAVGKRVMPEAEWIVGDVFSLGDIGHFDWAISNPPFGAIKTGSSVKGAYTGAKFEYRVIELASKLADNGTFIIPQQSAPFRYSGERGYRVAIETECAKFMEQTGIVLGNNCGLDTSSYLNEWKGVSPMCEIVVCEFERDDETEQTVAISAPQETAVATPAPAAIAAPVPAPAEVTPAQTAAEVSSAPLSEVLDAPAAPAPQATPIQSGPAVTVAPAPESTAAAPAELAAPSPAAGTQAPVPTGASPAGNAARASAAAPAESSSAAPGRQTKSVAARGAAKKPEYHELQLSLFDAA
ncbi:MULTISPECIES: methyltransferase [Pseudomonas]|uniref:methyltransferase n=1 Tax=Pseudomonas TaxID=286 RepID=UPI000A9A259C|nr:MULTISPECIES: methyltransferase [Pseudomonas]